MKCIFFGIWLPLFLFLSISLLSNSKAAIPISTKNHAHIYTLGKIPMNTLHWFSTRFFHCRHSHFPEKTDRFKISMKSTYTLCLSPFEHCSEIDFRQQWGEILEKKSKLNEKFGGIPYEIMNYETLQLVYCLFLCRISYFCSNISHVE